MQDNENNLEERVKDLERILVDVVNGRGVD